MKFIKGNFTVVPNLDRLVCLPPEWQTVFFWICVHADERGICFPTRKKLAYVSGMSVRSVDRAISELERMGVIAKTTRKKEESKENTSNLYQIVLSQFDCEVATGTTLPSDREDTTGGDRNDTETISNINYIQLTKEAKTLFSQDGADIIKKFEEVDPKNKTYYANKTERASADFLIQEYGKEFVESIIAILPKTNKIQYMPSVTKPSELKEKWGKLRDAIEKKKVEKEIKKTLVLF